MSTWIRRHADPDELLTVIIAVAWLWAGWSTWHDLIGHPRDAPHLRIAGHVRAVLWWASAAAALVGLRLPRTCGARKWSAAALGLMPTVRLGSYTASWAASWSFVDPLIPNDVMVGDPNAWGSLWIYVLLDVLVAARILAPWSWSYLDAMSTRRGRMEVPRRDR